jgi:predicted nucleotidyltransferase
MSSSSYVILFASYKIGNFTFSFIDLYVVSSENNLKQYHPDPKYLNSDRESTSHNIDVTASYPQKEIGFLV